ncbi:acylphosphatase [Candidatus Sumerlaeota bacterium]|nr:acylphosphatase [Candidatus Sumerlaeota bacterium]
MKRKRFKIVVEGRAQGVGFRPTAYRYATERNLTGWVSSASSGVVIEIEGDESQTGSFIHALEYHNRGASHPGYAFGGTDSPHLLI